MPKDLAFLNLNNGVLVPYIGSNSHFTDGTAKLVQRIVKCLLTVQGSNLLNREFGGSINTKLPSIYDDRDMGKNKNAVIESILVTERQIKEDDAIGKDGPEGQLGSLSFKDLSYNVNNTEWVVELSLRTVNGISVDFNSGIQL